jgi:CheY-like chemotaxis protein
MIRGPATAFGKRRERILFVEALTPVSPALSEQLECHGYGVDMARSAREALLLAQTGRWDAVMLNIGLPAMNGVEFYTRMNRASGRECLPVIFASGYSKQSLLQALQGTSRVSQLAGSSGVGPFLNRLEQCLQNGKLSAPT